MGQQQLLLIVLGIIIVSLAIYLGVVLFRANAIETKRNNVMNECLNLAGMAQQYYLRPSSIGGGNKSFTGWVIPQSLAVTSNGHFEATVYTDRVEIEGTGNEVVTGNDSVKVVTTVYSDRISTEIIK